VPLNLSLFIIIELKIIFRWTLTSNSTKKYTKYLKLTLRSSATSPISYAPPRLLLLQPPLTSRHASPLQLTLASSKPCTQTMLKTSKLQQTNTSKNVYQINTTKMKASKIGPFTQASPLKTKNKTSCKLSLFTTNSSTRTK
jgi:hypothetical protein